MHAAARFARLGFCAATLLALGAPARADEAAAQPAPVDPPLDPIGGFSGGMFLRTSDGQIVLFPGGRLQIDGAFFPRQTPKSGLTLRRARVELRGWLGPRFYFDVSADAAPQPPAGTDVAPSALPAADAYLAFAPFTDALIIQAGQFDAPFTLENRTSDAYTDFIERAMTARTLGAPRNKEVGVMAHGLVAGQRLYYAAGLFNGEGPGFRNVDNQADLIGRAVVSPLANSGGPWRGLSLGGSAWYGNHVLGPEAPVQATPGGVVFFVPHWSVGQPSPLAYTLHEQGTVTALGGELSLPLGDRFGLRGEVVWKRQHLAEVAPTAGVSAPSGAATLNGLAAYGELWVWLLGDGRLLPAPGRELPLRLGPDDRAVSLNDGLQLAVRGEVLKEDVTSSAPALGDPSVSTTRVVSGTVGLNYWHGRFVRLSANYVINAWSGSSADIMEVRGDGDLEHEALIRFAISL